MQVRIAKWRAQRQRQIAFIPEILCVFGVRSQHFIQDFAHTLGSC